jgi:hypothetical protein
MIIFVHRWRHVSTRELICVWGTCEFSTNTNITDFERWYEEFEVLIKWQLFCIFYNARKNTLFFWQCYKKYYRNSQNSWVIGYQKVWQIGWAMYILGNSRRPLVIFTKAWVHPASVSLHTKIYMLEQGNQMLLWHIRPKGSPSRFCQN